MSPFRQSNGTESVQVVGPKGTTHVESATAHTCSPLSCLSAVDLAHAGCLRLGGCLLRLRQLALGGLQQALALLGVGGCVARLRLARALHLVPEPI